MHGISKVFTNGVYNVLADALTASRDPRKRNNAEVLYDVDRKMADLTIQAFQDASSANATYADVAVGPQAGAEVAPNCTCCCDTMQQLAHEGD